MMAHSEYERTETMQAFELTILNWIQAHLRCGVLDAVMVPVSRICDHGEVWILLAAILLAIPKTRKLGACVACGLALDLLFCNLVLKPLIGRVRPFAVNPTISLLIPPPTDASFPSGHTQNVVGTLGGKFDIASTLGQGTTVTVTLPVYHPGQEHLHDKI